MRILQVEDEPDAAQFLAKGLREQGYAVDMAMDAPTASFKASITPYDLILLDAMLPDGDGFSLCREIRAGGCLAPILMLTACDSLENRISGLDAGADDYLTKPFEYKELLARVRALLRRGPQSFVETITVSDLRIDLRSRTVSRSHRPLPLTAKEYVILEFLARHKGRLVTREEISEHAWDENFDPFSNLIEVYMLRLRKKIDSERTEKLLRTRRGEGYMLVDEAAEC